MTASAPSRPIEGDWMLAGFVLGIVHARLDAVAVLTGTAIKTVTADAGYAYAKLYAGLEVRDITAVIPAKTEPIHSAVPMRRFGYDALNDVLKCLRGKKLKAGRVIKHGASSPPALGIVVAATSRISVFQRGA